MNILKFIRTTSSGYIYDNRIFLSATLILLCIVGYFVVTQGTAIRPYVRCDKDICVNPMMDKTNVCQGVMCGLVLCDEQWCTMEYLPKGEYGKKPFNMGSFILIVVSLFILAFVANHKIHNTGRQFDIGFQDSPIGKMLQRFKKEDDDENLNNQRK